MKIVWIFPFIFQAIEFFFFAALIGVVALLFAIMAYFFKYVKSDGSDISPEIEKDESTALIPEKDPPHDPHGEETKKPLDDHKDGYHSESEF